ncbi:hypothetical protein VU01_11033 [Candidatus Electrothrix marina]|uniref:Uncharacterized protein n=1 Tax=Candidatus Electrothrix marina TaxID=1859130 RepID=A0A444JEX9_9BACT|nr:hypothetical protein VU01_11033 [Candidatus Electrothrix marina]
MTNERTINCWEFKKCGREPNGINAFALGVCPVSTYDRLNGVHDGKNGGRCCWIFHGAFSCGMEDPASYEVETAECGKCDFYSLVKKSKELLVAS